MSDIGSLELDNRIKLILELLNDKTKYNSITLEQMKIIIESITEFYWQHNTKESKMVLSSALDEFYYTYIILNKIPINIKPFCLSVILKYVIKKNFVHEQLLNVAKLLISNGSCGIALGILEDQDMMLDQLLLDIFIDTYDFFYYHDKYQYDNVMLKEYLKLFAKHYLHPSNNQYKLLLSKGFFIDYDLCDSVFDKDTYIELTFKNASVNYNFIDEHKDLIDPKYYDLMKSAIFKNSSQYNIGHLNKIKKMFNINYNQTDMQTFCRETKKGEFQITIYKYLIKQGIKPTFESLLELLPKVAKNVPKIMTSVIDLAK